MLAKLSLKSRTVAIMIILSLLTAFLGGVSYLTLKRVVASFNHVTDSNFPNYVNVAMMRAANRSNFSRVARVVIPGIAPEEAKRLLSKIDETRAEYKAADKAYNDIPFVDGEEVVYTIANEGTKKYNEAEDQTIALINKGTAESMDAARKMVVGELTKTYLDADNKIKDLMNFHVKEATLHKGLAHDAAAKGNVTVLVLVVAIAVVSTVVGLLFAQWLAKALEGLSGQIQSGAEQVAANCETVSSAATELSSASTEQASSIQETASAVSEINSMVTKNAENAKKSKELSDESDAQARDGQRMMGEVQNAVRDIQTSNEAIVHQVEANNQELNEVVQVIREIGEKTKVINEIVFQTKLLSFNASVEAARAGEHGKGFAVVAEEVGNLAAMSGKAAQEITSLLTTSTERVERIVLDSKAKVSELIASGQTKVNLGLEITTRCGEALSVMVHKTQEVNTMVDSIAAASLEQARGVAEISKAISQMDETTQMNAQASHEVAASTEKLTQEASRLRGVVTELGHLIQGK